MHTGTPLLTEEGYVGEDVHLAARVSATGHGGQVVLTHATRMLRHGTPPLQDLGEHRLADFADPVVLYQLGVARFPPLRMISASNLPHPASTFVGRRRELDDVMGLVRGGARLVTLTGAGGIGKSRLALEAAAMLRPRYRLGVFWVALSPVRDPALVAGTIAQTPGAKVSPSDHIGEREILILPRAGSPRLGVPWPRVARHEPGAPARGR